MKTPIAILPLDSNAAFPTTPGIIYNTRLITFIRNISRYQFLLRNWNDQNFWKIVLKLMFMLFLLRHEYNNLNKMFKQMISDDYLKIPDVKRVRNYKFFIFVPTLRCTTIYEGCIVYYVFYALQDVNFHNRI